MTESDELSKLTSVRDRNNRKHVKNVKNQDKQCDRMCLSVHHRFKIDPLTSHGLLRVQTIASVFNMNAL